MSVIFVVLLVRAEALNFVTMQPARLANTLHNAAATLR